VQYTPPIKSNVNKINQLMTHLKKGQIDCQRLPPAVCEKRNKTRAKKKGNLDI